MDAEVRSRNTSDDQIPILDWLPKELAGAIVNFKVAILYQIGCCRSRHYQRGERNGCGQNFGKTTLD
jgi:hypothetical protein